MNINRKYELAELNGTLAWHTHPDGRPATTLTESPVVQVNVATDHPGRAEVARRLRELADLIETGCGFIEPLA